jgi:hypothetical protein
MPRAIVRQNKEPGVPGYRRWEVRWSDGHVIAALPTRSRAYGFADLVTAIQPMDADVTELKAEIVRLDERANGLEAQICSLRDALPAVED